MAKRGRPTKYKEEYCERLIAWMSKGMSFESFAGDIEVNQDTLHEWVKVHQDFSEAKKIAFAKAQVFWEKLGISGTAGKLKNFNNGAWIFNMKNRFKWRDRHEVTTRDETFKDPKDMSDEEIDDKLAYALNLIDRAQGESGTSKKTSEGSSKKKKATKKQTAKNRKSKK